MVGTTGGSRLIRTERFIFPWSVPILMVLNKVPLLPARLTLIFNEWLDPGGIVQGTGGSSAVVQPHEGRTERIVTGIGALLVNTTRLVLPPPLSPRPFFLPQNPAPLPGVTLVIQPVSIFFAILVKLKMNRAKSWPLVASTVLRIPSHARTPSGNGWPARDTSGT